MSRIFKDFFPSSSSFLHRPQPAPWFIDAEIENLHNMHVWRLLYVSPSCLCELPPPLQKTPGFMFGDVWSLVKRVILLLKQRITPLIILSVLETARHSQTPPPRGNEMDGGRKPKEAISRGSRFIDVSAKLQASSLEVSDDDLGEINTVSTGSLMGSWDTSNCGMSQRVGSRRGAPWHTCHVCSSGAEAIGSAG